MEQAFDLVELNITCRMDWSARTNGATLRVFGEDGITQIGADYIITEFVDDGTWNMQTFNNGGSGWQDARYIQIGGPGIGVPYLHIAELEAMAEMPVYEGFIPGVTVTASDAYAGHLAILGPQFLTDNGQMSDQSGPLVGDPSADCKPVNAGIWHSTKDPVDPTLIFDLGGSHEMNRMLIWNCNTPGHQETRAVKDVLIETSQDGFTYVPLADQNGAEAGNFTLTTAPLTEVTPEDPTIGAPYQNDIDLSGVEASYVRVTALSSYGDSYWCLSEVRFYSGSSQGDDLEGDLNGDGMVGSADLDIVRGNWGQSVNAGCLPCGDPSGDGSVGSADLDIVRANWGATAAAAVPEPAGMVMLLLGMIAVFAARRRT